MTTVTDSKYMKAGIITYYGTEISYSTQDKVFLLSTLEANKYFSSDDDRKCSNTSSWWLRTPGQNLYHTAYVWDGDVQTSGCGSAGNKCGVRPAMWITINS